MSLEDAEEEQNQLVYDLKDMDKGKIPAKRRFFLNNAELFLNAREKVINNFKSRILPMKNLDKIPTYDPTLDPTLEATVFDTPKPIKEQTKKLPFKLHERFLNKTDEKI